MDCKLRQRRPSVWRVYLSGGQIMQITTAAAESLGRALDAGFDVRYTGTIVIYFPWMYPRYRRGRLANSIFAYRNPYRFTIRPITRVCICEFISCLFPRFNGFFFCFLSSPLISRFATCVILTGTKDDG